MIKSSFKNIFTLEVLHTYFTDNICKGLVYTPSDITRHIIQRFFLKQTSIDKGFALYTETKTTISELLNYITSVTSVTSFDFIASTKTPILYQFTDLPVNEIGIVEFNSSKVKSYSEKGDIVLEGEFISKSISTSNVFFNISINFQDLIQLEEEGKLITYQAKFIARNTQWRYFILNNSKQSLGELSIKSNNDIEFVGPDEVELQNGDKAKRFAVKNQLLAFSEEPKYSFDLMSTTQKNGKYKNKILFKGLPDANPKVIEIETNKEEILVASLMYVYV